MGGREERHWGRVQFGKYHLNGGKEKARERYEREVCVCVYERERERGLCHLGEEKDFGMFSF